MKRIKNHGGVAKRYGHRLITGTSGVRISPSLPKYGNSAVGQRVCLGRTRSPVRVRLPIPNKTFEKDRTMKFKEAIKGRCANIYVCAFKDGSMKPVDDYLEKKIENR